MTIFVGLGNHESKYHKTKHNVGYWVLDSFAKKYDIDFKPGLYKQTKNFANISTNRQKH